MDTQVLNDIKDSIQMAIDFQVNNIKRDEYLVLSGMINSLMSLVESQENILMNSIAVAKVTGNSFLVTSIENLLKKLQMERMSLDSIKKSIDLLINRV